MMLNRFSKNLAVIDETQCIGCTICINACPFDAILGAAKQLHRVIASYCTGCKLCVAPCPVDCISMQVNPLTIEPDFAKPRFNEHRDCVSCDACRPVCPEQLKPDLIYTQLKANKFASAQSLDLNTCTLCSACDPVCPSAIPLAETFSYAQQILKHKQQKKDFVVTTKLRASRREERVAKALSFERDKISNQKDNIASILANLKNP